MTKKEKVVFQNEVNIETDNKPKIAGKRIGKHVIHTEMRDYEVASLDRLKTSIGFAGPRSAFIRVLIRNFTGYLVLDDEAMKTLRESRRAMKGIGVNINQMAKIANKSGTVDAQAFVSIAKELVPVLRKHNNTLDVLLDSRRRQRAGHDHAIKAVSS